MNELSEEMANLIRLQMLYNISNGWSWFAYKELGPENIIKVELAMWDAMLPPAVELLCQLIGPEGNVMEKVQQLITQVCKINGYVPKYTNETPESLTLEYTLCPNWDSMIQMNLDDYISKDGKPAKVSCIHGCTRIHQHYFKKIDPKLKMRSVKNRPNADDTCVFAISVR